MSTWEINEADNSVRDWSSFDEMVWEEFGESDDHIVPGVTGDGWTSGADRRKRVHRDQSSQGGVKTEPTGVAQKGDASGALIRSGKAEMLEDAAEDSGGEPVYDVSLPGTQLEDEEVPSLPEEIAAVTVSPPSAGEVAFLAAGGGLQHGSPGLSNGATKAGTDLGDMGVYIAGNQMFEEEDPAVVSTSCHFSLTDVGPAEGDVEFFEGDDEDGNRGNFFEYGCWDSIGHAEDMDKLFRNGAQASAQDNGGRAFNVAAETQQWLVTSASHSLPGSSPPDGQSGMVKIEEEELGSAGERGLGALQQPPLCSPASSEQEGQVDTLHHQQEQERKTLLEKHQKEQRLLELQHQQQQEQQLKKQEQQLHAEQSKLQEAEAEAQAVSSSSFMAAPDSMQRPSSEAETASIDEDGLSSLVSGETKKSSSSAQTPSTRRQPKKRSGRAGSSGRLTSPTSSPTVSSHSLQGSVSMSPGPVSPAPGLALRGPAPPPSPQPPPFALGMQRHRPRPYLQSAFMPSMHHMALPTGGGLPPLHQPGQLHDGQMQQPGMMASGPALYASQPMYQTPQRLQAQHLSNQMMPPPIPMQAGTMQPPMAHMQHLPGPGAVPGPMGFPQGPLLPQRGAPMAPHLASPMTPQEKIEKLKWRQKMRLAVEQRKQMHAHQMAEQQQQLQAAEQQDMASLVATGKAPSGALEMGQTMAGVPSGRADGAAVRPVEDGESVGAAVLHQLEFTMNKLDIGTRLCIRDALYRLARSSMQRKAASETKGGDGGDGDPGGASEQEAQGAPGLPTSPRLSAILETETNPIDRNIANLLFHRSGSTALFNSPPPLLQPGPSQQVFHGLGCGIGPVGGRPPMPQQGVMMQGQGMVMQGPPQGSWMWQAGAMPAGTWANSMPMTSGVVGGGSMRAPALGAGPLSMVQRMDTRQAGPMLVSRRQFMPSVGTAMLGGANRAPAPGGVGGMPPAASLAMPPGGAQKLGGPRVAMRMGMTPPGSSISGAATGSPMAGSMAGSSGVRPGAEGALLDSAGGTAAQMRGYALPAPAAATSMPPLRAGPPVVSGLGAAAVLPSAAGSLGVAPGLGGGHETGSAAANVVGEGLPLPQREGDAGSSRSEHGQQAAGRSGGNNGSRGATDGVSSMAEARPRGQVMEGLQDSSAAGEQPRLVTEAAAAGSAEPERGAPQMAPASSDEGPVGEAAGKGDLGDGKRGTARKGRAPGKGRISKAAPKATAAMRFSGGSK